MQNNRMALVCALSTLLSVMSPESSASQQTYGGAAYDAVYDVIQTDDGGYIAMGNSASFDPLLLYYDVYLIKTNAMGDLEWQKTMGSPYWESGYGFNKTSDGGYIIVGSKKDPAVNTTDVYVIKVDSSGSVQWEKTFGGPRNDKARAVQETLDGGYVLFGDSDSFGSVTFQQDMYVIKLDVNGDKQWETVIGGDYTEWTWGGLQTSDGGYAVIGDTRSYSNPLGWADVYLVKLDANGVQLWDQTYGDVSLDTGRSIIQTSDDGFVIAGEAYPSGSNAYKAYLIKTDPLGAMQWSQVYGLPFQDTVARCVKEIPGGGFIIAGEQNTISGTDKDGYLLRVDALGVPQWEKTYGGTSPEYIYSVSLTSDGGYVLAGRTLSYGAGNYDAFLIKLNSDGEHDDAWANLGSGLAGTSGVPSLVGTGSLAEGSSNAADLNNAAPSALAGLFLALSSTPVPFKGGTLLPFPFLPPVFLTTSASGTINIPFVMPSGVPAGTELWVQWGIQDGAAVAGVALSNALKGVTP